jgi:hypothetical protein
MFRAIETNDTTLLRSLAQMFLAKGNNPAALLCLDHVFRTPPRLGQADDPQVSSFLRSFHSYLQLLRSAAVDPIVHQRVGVQKLFALTVADDDTYHSAKSTFLHQLIIKQSWPCLLSTEEEVVLSAPQAALYIKQALLDRIKIRVAHQDGACMVMKAFSAPCIAHCIYAQCNAPGCNRQHVDVKNVTPEWYSRRVALHLQQILVVQVLPSIWFQRPGAH